MAASPGCQGIFPEPEVDPVIQIANMVGLPGADRPFIRNVFTLGTCAAIAGSHVMAFKKESELLEAWAEFVRASDCDMITGYNIMDFDFPYLMDRAKHLKCTKFPYLGRLKGQLSKLTEQKFTSKAFGSRVSLDLNIEGRLKFDMLSILRRDYKLRSYTLNAVWRWQPRLNINIYIWAAFVGAFCPAFLSSISPHSRRAASCFQCLDLLHAGCNADWRYAIRWYARLRACRSRRTF